MEDKVKEEEFAEDASEQAPRATTEARENPKEQSERLRRLPAQPVRIKELSPDMKRVCVAGTVISKNNDLYSFMIDDGEGNVLVLMNDVDRFQKIEIGQFVRVFAKLWGEGDEIELQADIVQDFSKIDKEIYTKLFLIKN